MNKYIEKMRAILERLQIVLRGIEQKKAQNKNIYQDWEKRNADLDSTKNEEIDTAKNKLTDIMNDVSLRLARYGCLQAKNLPADYILFTQDVPMEQGDIAKLVELHRDNYSLVQLARGYVDRHGIKGINFPPTPQEQLEAYEKFYNGACNMADILATSADTNLNDFANPAFCERLFDTVGSGKILSDVVLLNYAIDKPLKTYDYPKRTSFGFGFKPVQRHSSR